MAADAEAVAELLEAGRHCDAAARAERLVRDTVAAINANQVPEALQEELLGQANEVAAQTACPGPSEPQAAPAARQLAEWARERAA